MRKYRKQQYQENIEQERELARAYYHENKEARSEYCKKWRSENVEYMKNYRKKYLEKNREKIQQYRKRYYQENRDLFKETYRRRTAKIFEYINNVKKISGCSRCSEDNPLCLDFHHLNPEQKEIDIAHLTNKRTTIEAIQKEISKCAVLCSNCHRKLHSELEQRAWT